MSATSIARRGFASDNSATVHPEVLAAIARVNAGHAFAYGHDEYTESVQARLAEELGGAAEVLLTFNGSGANVLCLRAACRPWEGVICAESAHLNVDEGGAPEAIAGVKLLTLPGEEGKLTPELVQRRIARIGDEHAVQPRVVSISQCTELGTRYSLQEVRDLAELAHAHRLLLHVDGARLSNAAAALECSLAQASGELGVDILSFGGTKNGLLGVEAVAFFDAELAQGTLYLRKQTLQLASKMRFLAAQLEALLSDELWLRCAQQANAMATRLASLVGELPGLQITYPVQTNAVFATLPREAIERLQERWAFYVWDEARDEVRWMCSWDTTEQDVDEFAQAVERALG